MDTLIILGLLAATLIAGLIFRAQSRKALASTKLDIVPSRSTSRKSPPPAQAYVEPETRFAEPLQRKPYQLLNSAEQALFHRLREAMPNMLIFAQVGMAQLANLRGRRAVEEMRHMLGRSVDFLVCRNDFAILAAIELTWPTPESHGTISSEALKAQALERLGIPLIVFRPNALPDADTISREIAEAILRRNHLEAERERLRNSSALSPSLH